MSDNLPELRNPKNDEIDLLDLFRRIGRSTGKGLNAMGRGLLISIVFMVRRWLPLTISVIIGFALSILMWKNIRSFYTSDMILRVNVRPTDEVISYINRLHTYCLEGNKSFLANAINLNSKQAENILDIQAFWIIDNGHDNVPDYVDYDEDYDVYDTINLRMGDRLDIRVRINEPQELSNVSEGIMNFIKKEALFLQKNALRLRQDEEMLARLEYDIEQLDSLQKVKYFEESRSMVPKSGGQLIFLQEQKTQLLHGDIYQLYSRKQLLEESQDLYRDVVTVLSDFTIPSNRENSAFYYSVRMVPLIFGFVLLILIVLANRKKLNELYNKY